jgi:hypothetical protein
MNLSDNQVSQAIAAVMGLRFKGIPLLYDNTFSAFTPDGIWQWKSWMEREMTKEWVRYCRAMRIPEHEGLPFCTAERIVERVLNPRNLVKWLYDNLDQWGYVKCPCGGDGKVFNYDTRLEETCPFCTGTRKVLTERAKRFKAIVEGGE